MSDLNDDARRILAVFAEADGPVDWGDVVESLLPPRPRGPRRGGKRTWAARWEDLVRTAMELYKAGLLAELPTGPADMTVITEAGREVLLTSAQHAEQKAQGALAAARREAATVLARLNEPGASEVAL